MHFLTPKSALNNLIDSGTRDVNGRIIIYEKDNNSGNKQENLNKLKSKYVPNFYNNTW